MRTNNLILKSILTTLFFCMLGPTIGYTSHDDDNIIERMYNKHYKPTNSDEDAPMARSVTLTSTGYSFTFPNSDYHHLIPMSDIHDILNQGENGHLFRTYNKKLPHIRAKYLPKDTPSYQ